MENQKERSVYPGEIYRHFKGNLYQIVAVAVHSETGEPMVVYQALYGDFRVYVRPYEMFVSQVDGEKYPEVKQKYRFERRAVPGKGPYGEEKDAIRRETEGDIREDIIEKGGEDSEGPAEAEKEASQALLAFLDAEDLEERILRLKEMKGTASQSDLDSICVVLDRQRGKGSTEEQLDEIIHQLSLQKRYEGGRLR